MASLLLSSTTSCAVASLLACYLYTRYSQNAVKTARDLQSTLRSKDAKPSCTSMGRRKHFSSEWWTSQEQLALEFRAVFSKEWLLATHSSRFRKPGDYISVTIGGFPVLIVFGKDGEIRGFHDVCRHRAYKVSRKAAGSSLVFGCRYHGWSYDTKGALVRAPEFEKVPSFQWKENGLLPVAVRVSQEGFVFVNFSSKDSVPHFQHNGLQHVVPAHLGTSQETLIQEFTVKGAFNWKLYPSKTLDVSHSGSDFAEVHLFPSARICWSKNGRFWSILNSEPITDQETNIRIEIYARSAAATVENADLVAFEEQIRDHARLLEQFHAQIGQSSQEKDNWNNEFLDFQNEIEIRNKLHTELEKSLGDVIRSGSSQGEVSKQGIKDDLFCKTLEKECAGLPCNKMGKDLAW